jgi:hypothetical protein
MSSRQPLPPPYPPEPPGSEDRYKLKLRRPTSAPVSHATPSAGVWSARLPAIMLVLLALPFTAAGVLLLFHNGCEMWGFSSSIERCEPKSLPSRLPSALPLLVLAWPFWAGSAALFTVRRDVDTAACPPHRQIREALLTAQGMGRIT